MAIKILLVNAHSTLNNGDDALVLTTMRLLRENFGNAHLTVAMDVPDDYPGVDQTVPSLTCWVKTMPHGAQPTWRKLNLLFFWPVTLLIALLYRLTGRLFAGLAPPGLRPTLRSYAEADLVVSVPGGFIYSSGRGITLMLVLYTIVYGILLGKPVYVLPQSYGPLHHPWQRWLIGQALRRARLVMAREPLSMEVLQQCGVPKERCVLFPDLAFAFQGAPRVEALVWLAGQGITPGQDFPLLAINPMNWAAQNKHFARMEAYLEAITAAVQWFIETRQGKVLLLPQVFGPEPGYDDSLLVRQMQDRLLARHPNYKGSIIANQTNLTPFLIKAVFGCMDLVVGTHMHSNIFALSQGVPVVAIGYRPKTRGVARTAGVERFVIDIDAITPDGLVALLERCWEEREEIRTGLLERMPSLAQETSQSVRLCFEDYQRCCGRSA